jgi:nucleotide-binding universal stress UspA family protein
MRVLIWIAEETWEACVEQAGELLPAGAEATLLHVAPGDVEALAEGGWAGLLGRRPPRPPGEALSSISDAEAQALLEAARDRLGRPARLIARRGRVEREVVRASADADLLVLARDGAPGHGGPKSFGPRSRFVVDHVACPVLVLPREPWAADAPLLPPEPPPRPRPPGPRGRH